MIRHCSSTFRLTRWFIRFFEAVVLVILVVYLFLQNFRATLIPILAVPVSIIGAFAGMYLLGFSINLLTLFGLILAIGIVVDDAIIVLENVERLMSEEGLSPKEAAVKAMQEVSGPVVAVALVLSSVFLSDCFSRRHDRRDVSAVLGNDCRLGADFGAGRADADAVSLRPDNQTA